MSSNNKDIPVDASSKPSRDRERDTDSQNVAVKDSATANIQQLFLTLFFGLLTQFDDRYNVTGSSNNEIIAETNSIPCDSSNHEGADNLNTETSMVDEHTVDGVIDQIEKLIPHDPIALRHSTIYKSTISLLQWQRDNYLVGSEYAEWRKNDQLRQQKQERYFQANSVPNYDIPYNEKTISHHHISLLAGNFIPSPVVRNLLTPIVTGLFVKDTGVLFHPIKQNVIKLILDQQKILEVTMKNQLLHLLDNPRNRDAIKDSTQGIIIQTAHIDDAGHSNVK